MLCNKHVVSVILSQLVHWDYFSWGVMFCPHYICCMSVCPNSRIILLRLLLKFLSIPHPKTTTPTHATPEFFKWLNKEVGVYVYYSVHQFKNVLKGQFTKKWKFSHYLLPLMLIEGLVSPQNTAGVSQEKGVAVFQTVERNEDWDSNVKMEYTIKPLNALVYWPVNVAPISGTTGNSKRLKTWHQWRFQNNLACRGFRTLRITLNERIIVCFLKFDDCKTPAVCFVD